MSDTPLSEFLGEQPEESPANINSEIRQEIAEIARDEKGRFAAKTGDEPQPETPEAESVTPTPEPQEERIPIAALKDERQKRQQLEERLRQYDEYFAQLQRQPQQPVEEPDMFADPDGFKAHLAQQIRSELMQELQPAIQHGQTMSRAEVSELLARQKYQDYDAKIEVFKEAIQSNPFLLTQIQQAPDPATFAYNAALKYEEAKQYGTASPTREQIEAELREKIIAELNIPHRPKAPSTFASDRSVGSRSGPEWSGPTPLGQMLG